MDDHWARRNHIRTAVFGGVLAMLVIATTSPAFGAQIQEEPIVTIVEADLPDEMERGGMYPNGVTISNEQNERVFVEIEYQFDGTPYVIFEERLRAGDSVRLPFPDIDVEELEWMSDRRIDPGTYQHGFAVYAEDEDGNMIFQDRVVEDVEIVESQDEQSEGTSDGGTTSSDDDSASSSGSNDESADETNGSAEDSTEETDEIDEDGLSADEAAVADEPTRGFFSNDPESSMAFLDDPAALTWIGILVSILGILAQLVWRQ